MLELTPLAAALALSTSALAPQATEPTELPELTQTATRTERRSDAVPATVQRKAAESSTRDARDPFRNDVDVAVRSSAPRFGLASGGGGRAGAESLNIRGLEANQVLLMVDGLRLPQAFSFGPLATGRLDFLSLDAAKDLELLRGPASAAYGSDGLAGALALRTLDPEDLLKPGANWGGQHRAQLNSGDDSAAWRSAGAWRRGGFQGLLLLAQRAGHEQGTHGELALPDSRRTAPNPLRWSQRTALAKLQQGLSPRDQIGLTLEQLRRRTRTEVLSGRTPASATPAATAVLDLDGDDHQRRDRASLHWQHQDLDAEWLQLIDARVHRQQAETRQLSFEDRHSAADRSRDNRYRETSTALNLQAQAQWQSGQRWSAGLDWSETRITALRDGSPNPSAPPPHGETFPAKPFPDTDYEQLGAFVQLEAEHGAWTWLPALRADRFRLRPSSAGFMAPTVALSGSALSPRLGVVWQASPLLKPYAQWAKGFRAPAPSQVNNGFSNVAAGYRSVGNPNLEPERANSLELGLRGRLAQAWSWQLAAYDNRYADFISQQAVSGKGTPADPLVFQSINLSQARIRGAEARLRWQSAGWQLEAAAALARGHSQAAGAKRLPLDSIEPAKLHLGVGQQLGDWGWRLNLNHARAKEAKRIAAPKAFAPPAYTVADLRLNWRALPGLNLQAGVDNLADRRYWRWAEVRGLSVDSPVADAYSAPARTFHFTATLEF